MSDRTFRLRLNQLDVQSLIREQRLAGRANLNEGFREFWASQYEFASELLEDERRGRLVRKLASLLSDISYSLHASSNDTFLTYYPYTDVHILDWYIGRWHVPFDDLKKRVATGIKYLLHDLLHFETDSVAGFEGGHREGYDEGAVLDRIQRIRAAVDDCFELFARISLEPKGIDDLVHYDSLEGYACEASRLSALIHFTCMPQTKCHDEVLFLRAIHVSELCFYGVRVSAVEAIEWIGARDYEKAASTLRQAESFASMLHSMFKILRTMTPTQFAGFRDYTQRASAIQSKNYQLMEIYLRGVHPDKAPVYGENKFLRSLEKFAHPAFASLKRALAGLPKGHSACSRTLDSARELDRKLLTWRGLHVGFAKAYLPSEQPGTGGTSGASYLKRFLQTGIFDDTECDMEALKTIFPEIPDLQDACKITSEVRIAPRKPSKKHN